MKYTIFGSKGFIGGELVKELKTRKACEVNCPGRNFIPKKNESLGHVIYCIGLTADFRKHPLETVDAHVCMLGKVLKNSSFESFTYLSSTRVYQKVKKKYVKETDNVLVNSNDFSDLYNLSKLMGESMCLSFDNSKIKIARLSNVIGTDFENENFVTELIKEAVDKNKIILNSSPSSYKDYIYVKDVIDILVQLHTGRHRIYNIASGTNTKTSSLLKEIKKHASFNLVKKNNAKQFSFPKISTQRIKQDFNYKSKKISNQINLIIKSYKNESNN